MSIKITYFVHGTTVDNENHLSSGWKDVELSELGKKQSEELREIGFSTRGSSLKYLDSPYYCDNVSYPDILLAFTRYHDLDYLTKYNTIIKNNQRKRKR